MQTRFFTRTLKTCCLLATLICPTVFAQQKLMVVLDGSGSMWGRLDGASKIEISWDAWSGMADHWQPGSAAGLMAYGHREEKNCNDIEMLLPADTTDRDAWVSAVRPFG